MKRLLALVLSLAALAACAPAEPPAEDEAGYGVWFAVSGNGTRNDFSAVAREERRWEREPDARALIDALLSGPESEGLVSPFPWGVKVLAVTDGEAPGELQVDLSEQYGGLAGYDLTVADCCIVLTLCQLPGVETVTVTVEGEPIPYRDRQSLRVEDVLLSGVPEEGP